MRYSFHLQVSKPLKLGFQDAKCMHNNHTGRIEIPVEAPRPCSQVAIIPVRLHKLRQQRVGRSPNYVHSLRDTGQGTGDLLQDDEQLP